MGLMPPGFLLAEGQTMGHNVVQKHLWSCWTDLFKDRLPELLDGDNYDLLLAGDLIEGIHHKSKQIISPDVYDHVECAKACLNPIALEKYEDEYETGITVGRQCKKRWILKGTECHSGSSELAIGKSIKAQLNPDKHRAFDRLDMTLNGVRAVFVHHVATAMRTYLEASGIGIQMNSEQLEAAKQNEVIPQVFGYAHRHRFGMFVDSSGSAFVSPPWQGLTRHGHKVVSAARTVVGAVVLDWRGKKDGARPTVRPLLYKPTGQRIEL